MTEQTFTELSADIHGHTVYYRTVGTSGPPVVLIHGMVNSSRHWEAVALKLGERHRVIAPDLLGHGDSASPRTDYSLGAHATMIRDLLASIGVERATMVGHSLGGGVAMQYFWQFPDQVERLALISAGGLGPEVSPLLRAAALPGMSAVVAAAAHPRLLDLLRNRGKKLAENGNNLGVQLQAIARALRPLERAGAREAFLQTLRSVIDIHGQRVAATDKLYLLEKMPLLVVWGERDHTIPLHHGEAAHRAVPGSRFATIPKAAHFPHLERPDELAEILIEFIDATEPADADLDWQQILAGRPHGDQIAA